MYLAVVPFNILNEICQREMEVAACALADGKSPVAVLQHAHDPGAVLIIGCVVSDVAAERRRINWGQFSELAHYRFSVFNSFSLHSLLH